MKVNQFLLLTVSTFILLNLFAIRPDTISASELSSMDGKELQITNGSSDEVSPDIYEDKIVWSGFDNGYYNDVFLYDIGLKNKIKITNSQRSSENPSIYDNKIVWEDHRTSSSHIYLYDINTEKEFEIRTDNTHGFNGTFNEQSSPSIYNNVIVWADSRNGWINGKINWNIYIYNLDTKIERQLSSNSVFQTDPSIYEDKIVWSAFYNGNWGIFMYDLNTNEITQITKEDYQQSSPSIYKDKIVWSSNGDIYMYDLNTKEEVQLTNDDYQQQEPSIYKDKIVWSDNRNGNWDIYMYVIQSDITSPLPPQVNEVNNIDTFVTGTAEAGSTITVKAGMTVLGTATTTAEGKYTVTIPKQKAGTKLTVTATDIAGNISEVREVTVKDVTAPIVPTVNEVKETSTSVIGTAEAGSTITVKAGATVIGTATVDVEDKYTVTIEKQKAGTKLSVTATDDAGNISEVTEVKVKDVAAPSVPTINEVTDKSTDVTGTAEADSTITVKAGATVIGTASVDAEDKYTVTIEKQKAGTKLSVTATDDAGNVSEVKEVTIKDVTASTVPTVNAIYDNSTVINGKAETNATVYAMVGSKKIGETTAKNGAYTIKITKQKAGTNISVNAVDLAGNKSASKSIKVIDKTAPKTLTVNKVTNKITSVTGKTEAKATVEVKLGSKLLGKATADSKGNYKVKIKAQKKGKKLTVIARDRAKNAKTVTVTVK